MMTLRQLARPCETIPMATSWYLADLGEARGKQELYKRQSPQRLRVLREHAIIESVISSNRIEGVEIDKSRVGTIILLYILKTASTEFEKRVGTVTGPRGAKTQMILGAVGRASDPFRVADIQVACPGVGVDLIRKVLKQQREAGKVECLGRGQSATWQKTAGWGG